LRSRRRAWSRKFFEREASQPSKSAPPASSTGLGSLRISRPPSSNAVQPCSPGSRSQTSSCALDSANASVSAAAASGRSSGAHTGASWSATPCPTKRSARRGRLRHS
jgi:hypothetical protein